MSAAISADPGIQRRSLRSVVAGVTETDLLAAIIVLGEWTGLVRGVTGVPALSLLLDGLLFLLAAAVLLRAVQGRQVRLDTAPILVGAYMLFALVEIANPNVPALSAGIEGFRKTAFTMLAFFVAAYGKRADALRFYVVVALGSIPTFIWATRQAIAPAGFELNIIATSGTSSITYHSSGILRGFAPMAGPFHLGLMAACVTVVALAFSLRGRSALWLVVAAISGWAVGISLTRANMIAAAVAVLVVVFLGNRRAKWRLVPVVRAAVPIVAVLAATLVLGSGLPSRLEEAAADNQPTASASPSPSAAGSVPGGTAPSTQPSPAPAPQSTPTPVPTREPDVLRQLDPKNLRLRFGYWLDFLGAIVEQPVIGYGTSAAADGFGRYYDGTGKRNFEPHSMYLKPALELGLGGLAIFIGLLLLFARRAWTTYRRDSRTGLAAIGILVVVSVSGITGPLLDAYPVNLLFWAAFGLAWRFGVSDMTPRIDGAVRDVMT